MDFWQLAFSASGATIAICITIIVVAIVIYLLSRRFPQISLQYGSSKLELRREQSLTETKVAQTGVSPELPTTITRAEKDISEVLPAIGPTEDLGNRYFELSKAVEKQDRSQIDKIFESFKSKTPPYAPYNLEVWKYAELLRAGFDDARNELERIEKENQKDIDASHALARYYLGIRASEQALSHIDVLFARSDNDEKLASAILLKAEFLENCGRSDDAIKYLLSEVKRISNLEASSKIYEDLADRYKKAKRDGLAMAAYERALHCSVHNKSARFQLAYLYSQNDALRSLAIRHYRILLRQDPAYWYAENNLGILYQQFGLNVYKIEAWEAALGRNDGYSLGNLMFAYLDIGFLDKAKELYDGSPSYLRSNPRVVAGYSQLQGVRGEEDKKLDQIREGAEAIWRELGRASILLDKPAQGWIGEWREIGGGATLKVGQSGEFFQVEQAEGAIVRKGMAKMGDGLGIVSVSQESRTEGALGLLSQLGSYGYLIICSVEEGLKTIYIRNDTLISARTYTRAEASSS